jgi:anti-sigma B factor antagonist
MKTAVGVFAAREPAEEAVRRLLAHHVPEERIVYLTRSEAEVKEIGKQLQASTVSAHAIPESMPSHQNGTPLAIPGVGQIFALGPGASKLFGAAVSADTASNDIVIQASDTPAPRPTSDASEDSAFFCKVLKEGYSIVVVRTDSSQIASTACEILDQLGLGMKRSAGPKSSVTSRQVTGAVVADFVGKIALSEGTALLRDAVRNYLEHGYTRILLNLERVEFIDSAGLGELVRIEATVRNRGGQLKLVRPNANVHHLFRITKLDRVFDIAPDEFAALSSMQQGNRTRSAPE